MKITHVIRRLAFDEWGGTETAVWNSSKQLKALGNEIEVLSTKALCKTEAEKRDGLLIRRFNYFYPQLFLSTENKLKLDKKGGSPFSYSLYKYLIQDKTDLIHSHTMGRVAQTALKAAHKKNIPFIISFHGGNYDVPKSEIDEMLKPLKGSLGYGRILDKLQGLSHNIVEQANGIICVGKNEYEITSEKFPHKCVAYIPNGVETSKFIQTPDLSFRTQYNIPSDRRMLLCVSRIDYQKNQLSLIKLTRELIAKGENVQCVLIGFVTSEEYFSEIVKSVSEFQLEDRVTIVKGLPPDSELLLSAYQQASLFILPSIHEPFGIVILEAWSSRLPTIASAVGGLKTLIKNGENGFLFKTNDIGEMLAAYQNALSGKERISDNAFHEVTTTYSWKAISLQISNFYKKVAHAFNGK